MKGLAAFIKAHGEKSLIAGYIASRTPRSYHLSDQVSVIPGSFIDTYLS
jgi:hypothetical protein